MPVIQATIEEFFSLSIPSQTYVLAIFYFKFHVSDAIPDIFDDKFCFIVFLRKTENERVYRFQLKTFNLPKRRQSGSIIPIN